MISYKLLTAKPETPFQLSGFFAIVAKRAFFGLAIFKGVKTITKYSAAKKRPFDAISSSRFPRTRYPILCTMLSFSATVKYQHATTISVMQEDEKYLGCQ